MQPGNSLKGHLQINRVIFDADTCIAHGFRGGESGSRSGEGIQNDTASQRKHGPNQGPQEGLGLETRMGRKLSLGGPGRM